MARTSSCVSSILYRWRPRDNCSIDVLISSIFLVHRINIGIWEHKDDSRKIFKFLGFFFRHNSLKASVGSGTAGVDFLLCLLHTDAETLGTSLLVGANHFFGGGFVVFGEVHDEEPVVVVAALEQYIVGANLVGDVGHRR